MNNKNDEKPWEKTFEEDRDEQGKQIVEMPKIIQC